MLKKKNKMMQHILFGDSKLLWIKMANTYENLCGNCVGGVKFVKFSQKFYCSHCGMTCSTILLKLTHDDVADLKMESKFHFCMLQH
jgi:hypothetical protein